MNRKIEWLITIVDRRRGDKVAEVYQRHHVAVQLVTHGRGTATSKIMDVLGLDEPEKDIVLSLVPGALSRDIFRALEEELHFTRPGAGIAFSILLSGISTAAHSRVTHGRLELCLPQEETSMTSEQHELIVAVTDADGVDIVMDAARAAGEVCSETAQKLFGLPIQPEKELVLILVPAGIRQTVMQAICDTVAQQTPQRAFTFSLPVSGVLGLR